MKALQHEQDLITEEYQEKLSQDADRSLLAPIEAEMDRVRKQMEATHEEMQKIVDSVEEVDITNDSCSEAS